MDRVRRGARKSGIVVAIGLSCFVPATAMSEPAPSLQVSSPGFADTVPCMIQGYVDVTPGTHFVFTRADSCSGVRHQTEDNALNGLAHGANGLTDCGKTRSLHHTSRFAHGPSRVRIARRMRKKAVQQGRSERRGGIVLVPYGEPLSDARTPLAAFFRILLKMEGCDRMSDQKSDLALLKIQAKGLPKSPPGYAGVIRPDQEATGACCKEIPVRTTTIANPND